MHPTLEYINSLFIFKLHVLGKTKYLIIESCFQTSRGLAQLLNVVLLIILINSAPRLFKRQIKLNKPTLFGVRCEACRGK